MQISVRHITRYAYSETASYTVQTLRLRPPSFRGQKVLEWTVKTPAKGPTLQFHDGFGNAVEVITVSGPHTELLYEASGIVECEDYCGVVTGLVSPSPPRVFLKETPQTTPDEAIADLARSISATDNLKRMHALAEAIRDRVDYQVGITEAHTGAAEALAAGKGVCQDHAHIFIAAARVLGVPARYVTGYLAKDDPEPAEAHHAWAESWIEGLGWVGFDVANRICPTDWYVRLAVGLDAGTAAPIVGSRRGGGSETLTVTVAAHRAASPAQTQTQSQSAQGQTQTQTTPPQKQNQKKPRSKG